MGGWNVTSGPVNNNGAAEALGAVDNRSYDQGEINAVTREVLLPRRADLQAKGTTAAQRLRAVEDALNYGREHNITASTVWEALRRYGRGADFKQLQGDYHEKLMQDLAGFLKDRPAAPTSALEKLLGGGQPSLPPTARGLKEP